MLGTGRDFGYVNWEASRWRLAVMLTSRSYALNLGGFRSTIRRHPFLDVARGCKNRLSKGICLLVVAHRFCVLRAGWCQRWCQILRHPAGGILMHTFHIL